MTNNQKDELEALRTRLSKLENRAPSPANRADVRKPSRRKNMLLWGLVIIGAVAFLAYVTAPETIDDYAKQQMSNCINNKGFGGWSGSDHISLEKYCEAYGAIKALEEDKKEHPEFY